MRKKIKIIFVFFLVFNLAYSHKNTYFKKQFGNIELVSSTYYYTEDINKNLIIGKYVQLLSQLLKYDQSIRVILNQDETIKFNAWFNDLNQKDETSSLNIMINSHDKDVSKCLALIEKVIINSNRLKKEKNNFQHWYSSINLSMNVKEILNIQVYRPTDIEQLPKVKFFDYYFQDNYFHIVSKANCANKELGVFDDIIQFSEPKYYTLCVFTKINNLMIFEASCAYDHDVKDYYLKSESTELKIEKRKDFFTSFRPYKISSIGNTILIIESMWAEDIYLYSIAKKIFIDDLEKQIEK